MKLSSLTLPVATVSVMAIGQIAFGVLYVGTCELRAHGAGQCDAQWQTAQALIFGGASTGIGLNTLNPALRTGGTTRRRDEHGRFTSDADG
jgi:hypothetical protein